MPADVFEPEIASFGAPESEPAPDVFGYDEAGATYPSDVLPEISYTRDIEVPPSPDVIPDSKQGFDWSSMFKTISRPIGEALGTGIGKAVAGQPTYGINSSAAGSGPSGLPNRNPFILPSFLRFGSGTSSAVSTQNPSTIMWVLIVAVLGFIFLRAVSR